MFVKESYGDQNTVADKYGIDGEEEETLSFCEFSINSDADAWEDSSRESQNSSFKSSEQEEDDYFEFFSGELRTNTTASYQPENIIFCGKIIPYKQPISENPKNVVKEKKHRRRDLFFRWRWSFSSSYKTRTSRKNDINEAKHPCTTINPQKDLQPESPKQKYSTRKRSKLHGFSADKMSILTSPSKSRWYLYLFGITRFRSEMELRDIKNRQSRSPSVTLLRLEAREDKKRESKGPWGLLRALSCSGGHPNAVVQASVGRIPQM